jgi:hypothetical protein
MALIGLGSFLIFQKSTILSTSQKRTVYQRDDLEHTAFKPRFENCHVLNQIVVSALHFFV